MESRSGRLRGSNKKTEGNLCFFLCVQSADEVKPQTQLITLYRAAAKRGLVGHTLAALPGF